LSEAARWRGGIRLRKSASLYLYWAWCAPVTRGGENLGMDVVFWAEIEGFFGILCLAPVALCASRMRTGIDGG
jgi:hypothetical protein